MNPEECYGLCCKYHGKIVRVHARNGQVHLGRIIDVSEESVWLEPVSSSTRNLGFGYNGYDDFGRDYGYDADYDNYYSYGAGAAYELAFGFIIGIALAALFFF